MRRYIVRFKYIEGEEVKTGVCITNKYCPERKLLIERLKKQTGKDIVEITKSRPMEEGGLDD